MEEHPGNGTRFRGFDLSKRRYGIESFECGGCPNTCEVKKVSIEGERPLFYGSRCEKYDIRGQKEKAEIPDLFSEREALLLSYVDSNNKGLGAKRIGIPRILFFYDLLPLFATFFQELGFQVILSDKTNKKTIHDGLEQIVAETCFPIKVAHGHVLNLLEKDLDFVFLPSLINLMQDNPKIEGSYACPYVQAFPYTIKAAIDFESSDVEVLQPILHLRRGIGGFLDEMSGLSCKLERDKATIKQAARKAWRAQLDFLEKIEQRGQEILKDLKRWEFAIVIVSRPYNGCDSGINLDLPRKLLKLGAIAIPMDFLPLKTIDLSHDWPNMYWRYGQRILAAADLINRNPRLNAIYITNFGCGPDSFILKFFKERMSGRPYLQIEIDEHSADVGAITRCEAFLDSLRHAKRKEVIKTRRKRHAKLSLLNRTIYIPYMGDQSYGLRAAFLACGIQAEVIPESDQKTLELGRRYTTGKECYPCIITTGDMVKMVQDPDFDRDRSAFFMPTGRGPCRFGQYHKLHEMVLDEIGYQDVPIIAPNQGESLYRDLGEVGKGFLRLAWLGILGIDLLDKKLRETRPYEVKPGTTDRVYKECLDEFCQAIIERRDIAERLKRCRERLDEVETHIMDKPVIGIVGEIFVRSNHFSNSYIIRMIEDLGGEVWLPPITEWILYTNYTRKLLLKEKKKYLSLVGLLLKDFFQRRTEDRIAEIFRGSIKNLEEPGIEDTLEYSRRFLDPSFEGEAVLSIGKSIDFISKGASGLVNVMPFTCMPGTIVTSILKLVREQNENIPCLYMAFDGLEQTNTKTRLEAFMHQATQFHKRRLETSIYP
jgi:predicted nucleotide-binding protein (sugar kinase/HSP70/actin superfamily)